MRFQPEHTRIFHSLEKNQLVRNVESDVLCRIHNYMHLRRLLVVDDSNPADNNIITRFNDCK